MSLAGTDGRTGVWERAGALVARMVDAGVMDDAAAGGDDSAVRMLLDAGPEGTVLALERAATSPPPEGREAPFDVPGEAEAFLSSPEAYATGFFVVEMLNGLLSGDVDYPDFRGGASFEELDAAIGQRAEEDAGWRRAAGHLRKELGLPPPPPPPPTPSEGEQARGGGLAAAVAAAILGFDALVGEALSLRPGWKGWARLEGMGVRAAPGVNFYS